MKDDEPRYVSADGPVNLRQARREAQARAPVSEEALARVQRVHARHQMGTPLQAQLRATAESMPQPVHAAQIGGAIGAAGGGVLLLLGAIQPSAVMAGLGAAALVGSLAVLGWWWRRHAVRPAAAAAAPLFDDEALGRFDAALESASAELTEPLCRQLLALKDSLVRVGSRAARISTDEHFTNEHRMHLLQCVRRYVPDSLEAYLQVPAAQRLSAAVGQGESADALLSRQLAMLQAEVDRHEEALGRSAAEGLLRQQRFLEARRRR